MYSHNSSFKDLKSFITFEQQNSDTHRQVLEQDFPDLVEKLIKAEEKRRERKYRKEDKDNYGPLFEEEADLMSKLYDSDFYAWTLEQAKLLREQKWELVDITNLVEEIETLGRQERRELRNRLGLLLGHLLKWEYQPNRRSNSWLATIREQRREIETLLQDNPSLKPYLGEVIQKAYASGLDLAVRETNLSYATFPEICPYTLEQALDAEFLPNGEEPE